MAGGRCRTGPARHLHLNVPIRIHPGAAPRRQSMPPGWGLPGEGRAGRGPTLASAPSRAAGGGWGLGWCRGYWGCRGGGRGGSPEMWCEGKDMNPECLQEALDPRCLQCSPVLWVGHTSEVAGEQGCKPV